MGRRENKSPLRPLIDGDETHGTKELQSWQIRRAGISHVFKNRNGASESTWQSLLRKQSPFFSSVYLWVRSSWKAQIAHCYDPSTDQPMQVCSLCKGAQVQCFNLFLDRQVNSTALANNAAPPTTSFGCHWLRRWTSRALRCQSSSTKFEIFTVAYTWRRGTVESRLRCF